MTCSVDLPYGAFELKRCYQRNMFLGTAFGFFLTLTVVAVAWLLRPAAAQTGGTVVDPGPDSTLIIIKWGLPPSIEDEGGLPDVGRSASGNIKDGIPVIIDPGGYLEEENTLPTRYERGLAQPTSHHSGMGDGVMPPIYIDDPVPPDTFRAVEIQPAIVHEEPAVYPRLALEGGFSARVHVKAYVDHNGRVKKAEVVKCTRPGMGFEEAAVSAAYKYIYRPAVQNGNPVGVWIAYRVDFIIE